MKFTRNPRLILIISFIILILIGAFLLEFSFLLEGNSSFSLIDAFATSTSAVTVTGLWFYPQFTLSEFSFFGKIVILILIQLGGLGAMTAGAFLLIFLRGGLTFTEQDTMRELLDRKFLAGVAPLIRTIITYTALIELIGFIAYLSQWIRIYPLDKALFYSLFHSVSAFCNAGFTLYSDSFLQFQTDLAVNLVTISLIILGGLGFVVLFTLKSKIGSSLFGRKPKRFDLHSKIVIFSTLFLILFGILVFFSFEAAYMDLSLENKILVSLFQSITTRTAGFSTVEIGGLSSPTLFSFIILMFIGAGPLSTSGGIKVTTFFLALLLIWSILNRRTEVEVWKYRIPDTIIWRAICLLILSFLILSILLGILLATENYGFEKILFELNSAFGTVGLSTGITPYLSIPGKIVISIVMLFGRLGPLTLIYTIARRKERPEIHLVEDRSVIVG